MIAANSEGLSTPEAATNESTHWLHGRYFVPLPDLSDETRQAIYAGRAAATWLEITTRLRDIERRSADTAARKAAYVGRIEGLGVNGLAEAVGCSHTTALKHLRHLEALGLIRTEQVGFTLEADAATGRIRRNYAKAPPKVIVVTIEDRHCRPSRGARHRIGDTPGTGPKASGHTPETGGKATNPQARNWRVSKERTSKEVRSFGTNRRRSAAGPLGRPASPAAQTTQQAAPQPTDWERQAAEEQRERTRQRQAEFVSQCLGMPVIEVIGLWKANPDELKNRCVAAGIMTPEGKWLRSRPLCAALAVPRKAEAPPPDKESYERFLSVSESILAIREKAEESQDSDEIEKAKKAAIRLLANYANAEQLKAVSA